MPPCESAIRCDITIDDLAEVWNAMEAVIQRNNSAVEQRPYSSLGAPAMFT